MKNRFIAIISVVSFLVIPACAKHEAPEKSADVQEIVSPAPENAEHFVVSVKTSHGSISDELFDIAWEVPSFGIEAIDARIDEKVKSFIANEQKLFKDNLNEDIVARLSLKIHFEVVRASETGIDLLFSADRFITGNAHPGTDIWTMMFDAKSGMEITRDDLLKSGIIQEEKLKSEVMRLIPDALKKVGIENFSDELIQDASDNPALFSNIARTDNGVRAFIAPGELAGAITQTIAVDILK